MAIADAGLKSTDDVAVIFDNETFYSDVFGDDAAAFRFAELPVKRKPADAVVKALLLGEARTGSRMDRTRWQCQSGRGSGFISSGGARRCRGSRPVVPTEWQRNSGRNVLRSICQGRRAICGLRPKYKRWWMTSFNSKQPSRCRLVG